MLYSWVRVAFAALTFFCVGCTHLYYQPDRVKHFPPEKFGYAPEEIRFKSPDGTQLVAWYFASQQKAKKGMIIQFHGNAENISSHYIALAWITHHGYDLFTFDYRGYGLSQGSPTPEGVHADSVAALNRAFEMYSKDLESASPQKRKFIVVGQSLGGAIAMRAIEDTAFKDSIDLVVLDSTFSSYRKLARNLLSARWFTWPLSLLTGILVSDEFSPLDSIRKNKTPILVIHDKRDPAVPFEEGLRIFEESTAKKELWSLDDGSHISFFSRKHEDRQKEFLEFINKG